MVLTSDTRIFRVEQGRPVFDGVQYEWTECEGWYVVSPGNVYEYLRWLQERRAAERLEGVPD